MDYLESLVKKLLLASLLLPVCASAVEILTAPSADTPAYAVVVVDSRKLKTSLRDALAAFPGEECVQTADVNVILSCPGLRFTGAYAYNNIDGFPKYTDPRDPRKELRIDGLKEKNFSNFRVPGQCTLGPLGPVCPPIPPPEAVSVTFTRPTTEFGFAFKSTREGMDEPLINGFEVTVNGNYIGFYPVSPDNVVQYFGIGAPEGLQSIDIVGVRIVDGTNLLGAWFGGRLYYR